MPDIIFWARVAAYAYKAKGRVIRMFGAHTKEEMETVKQERDFYFRKAPENWTVPGVLDTDIEAVKSLRFLLDEILEERAEKPEIVDGVLKLLKRRYQEIYLEE